MTWKHWGVLGTFFLGFVWPGAWVISLGLFEFGIRHGRDVAAFWAESHISSHSTRNRN